MMTTAHGAAGGHGTHLLMTLGPMVLIAFAATLSDVRHRLGRPALPAMLVVAAGLSAVAAVIHVVAAPEHFEESMLYGMFFAICAAGQLAWPAYAVIRPGRWVLWAGATGNLLVAGLWLWTRTAGIPLGPERGVVESVGALDLVASVTEVGIVLLCGWALTVSRQAVRMSPKVA